MNTNIEGKEWLHQNIYRQTVNSRTVEMSDCGEEEGEKGAGYRPQTDRCHTPRHSDYIQ